jgi:hypothetical protein
MADAESISLEETNKIRISLGLKPLTDDKGPADTQEKEAEDNYAKRKEQAARERETRLHLYLACVRLVNSQAFFQNAVLSSRE